MPYTPTYAAGFKNLPDTSTPITAASLNAMSDELASYNAAWTSWTPTISGTGWAIGDGTSTGKYAQVGKLVYCNAEVTFGAGTTFGAGNLSCSIPITAAAASLQYVGNCRLSDTGVGAYPGVVALATTTTVLIYALRADGTYTSQNNVTSTIPFTWGSTDVIRWQGFYEAA